ncbi:MAG: hypothetical protein GWP05_10930, partial [Anaerolineaceae bacterium]|nr:hypothetical protein [Anaerolineaceae bacterium]
MSSQRIERKSWVVAVLLGMVLPGLGHWYLQRRVKALVFFVCITGLFVVGWGLGEWKIVREDLLFLAQVLIGALAFVAKYASEALIKRSGEPDFVRVAFEMGMLYTLVAGFLNLLVILD